MMTRKTQTGFSLIEILIVVAVIAILAAVALPAYNGYVNRGKLKTAQADLSALSLAFEQQYQKMLTYPAATKNETQLKADFDTWVPAAEDFTYSSTVATTSTYTLSAVGSGGTGNCVLTINQAGVKTLGDNGASTCPYKETDGGWL